MKGERLLGYRHEHDEHGFPAFHQPLGAAKPREGLDGAGKTCCRLLAGFLSILGVISMGNIFLLAAACGTAAFAVLVRRPTSRLVLGRLLVLLPFLGFMTLPLLLGGGYPPAPERLALSGQLLLRILAATLFTLYIFINEPVDRVLEALDRLRLPPVVFTVAYLAYRYADLFVRELSKVNQAIHSRLFRPGLGRGGLAVYGELAGGMMLRAFNRSERVSQAMSARGFQGRMPAPASFRFRFGDCLTALPFPLLMAILLFMEQVVLK